MKKSFITSALLCFLSLTFLLIVSCSKDSTSTYPISGLWIGSYTVNDQPELGTQYYSFSIKEDGSLIVETQGDNAQQLAKGTWTLENKTLTANYVYIYGDHINANQTVTATWNNNGSLKGTWQDVFPGPNSGSFTLHRVN